MKTKENMKNKNFTKLTHAGISLIVLVITIIVIIILASAVILTINKNNPVKEANKARYESDRANMQAIFTNAMAKVMTKNKATASVTAAQINQVTTGVKQTTGEVSYTLTNAESIENTNGKIIFGKGTNTDTEFYTGRELPIYAAGKTTWYVDEEGIVSLEVVGKKYGEGKIAEVPFAQIVAQEPTIYYGEIVTNYETENETIDSQVDWQVFYSDGKNIYLIASDYVANANLPKAIKKNANGTTTELALNTNGNYKAYFTNILGAYNGSEDITDTKLQALNSDYYNYLADGETTSTNNNMKAVAYMMDTNIWSMFAGSDAEYAIGGPTLEMLFKSYNQKYAEEGVDYRTQVTVLNGYHISKDGGANWANNYGGMIKTSDTQYVINAADRKANGMWLASPSASYAYNVVYVHCSGIVGHADYRNSHLGFRPLVSLKSNVSLKAVEGGFEIVS